MCECGVCVCIGNVAAPVRQFQLQENEEDAAEGGPGLLVMARVVLPVLYHLTCSSHFFLFPPPLPSSSYLPAAEEPRSQPRLNSWKSGLGNSGSQSHVHRTRCRHQVLNINNPHQSDCHSSYVLQLIRRIKHWKQRKEPEKPTTNWFSSSANEFGFSKCEGIPLPIDIKWPWNVTISFQWLQLV